jgi:small conductance mechanosensitive channel
MTLRKTSVRDKDGTLYVVPNSQITTVANQSVGFSMAWVHVSVDFSANPDVVMGLLKEIAMDVRSSEEFRQVFVADPQVLGVDSLKGSEVIFLVTLKTLANKQYGPVREFKRRVRLALEERHLLPGDPNRVFSAFVDGGAQGRSREAQEAEPESDPTLLKPQDGSPFGGS